MTNLSETAVCRVKSFIVRLLPLTPEKVDHAESSLSDVNIVLVTMLGSAVY